MRTITHHTTLFYYDSPQVFEARDALGGHYIATSCCDENEVERFVVAKVEPDRLRLFRTGRIDLLSLLLERLGAMWYLTAAGAEIGSSIPLEAQSTPLEESAFLPDPGFVLSYLPPIAQTLLETGVRQAS